MKKDDSYKNDSISFVSEGESPGLFNPQKNQNLSRVMVVCRIRPLNQQVSIFLINFKYFKESAIKWRGYMLRFNK